MGQALARARLAALVYVLTTKVFWGIHGDGRRTCATRSTAST